MAMNTPGLVRFSQEPKNERVLPKGMQSEQAQEAMLGMFNSLNKFVGQDLPTLKQAPRRAVGLIR